MGMHHPAGGASPQQGQKKRVIPFGKYLLLDRIAVGGMAEVFLAKSFGIEGFEKIIAIKRILPTMAEDDDFIEMFIDEAKIAGHLNHANIVPIYELGKIGDSHYIAMEYVWGKDLLQIMNRFRKMRKRMPPAMVAHIAGRMCEALEYAHSKRDRRGNPLNLIHRDISPQNILVSYDGAVKLIDFGIAKAASRTTKTQAGVLKGKFGYMSPEQVRGLPIDHRSDIFAVGTCMYEMLTADRLFTGESDFSTLEKVRHAQVAPPSQVVAGVPKQFDEILMRALAREPADRWQSAGELHEALQEFLVTQRPPFTSGKLAAWMSSAFTKELEKEKNKLDSYAHVGRPSVAGGERRSVPASGPRPTKAPPPRPKVPEVQELDPSDLVEEDHDVFDDDELQGEATMITSSPFDAMQEEAESEELEAEPTQIFFSADDLEEVGVEAVEEETKAFSTGPRARLQQGPLGGVPGPRPAPGQAAGGAGAVGDQRATMGPGEGGLMAPPGSGPSFAMPPGGAGKQRHMATTEMPRVDPDEGKGKKMALMAIAAVVMIALGVGGAILAFGGPGHGTIEVRTVPDVGAEVRVDGIPRGVAPVRVDGIEEGSRVVTIVAPGYRAVQRDVQVGAGGTAMLDVVLISDPNSQVASASASEEEEEEAEEEAPAEEEEEEAAEEEEEEEVASNAAEEEEEEEAQDAEEPEERPTTMRVASTGGGSVMRIQRDSEPSGIMRIQRNTGGGGGESMTSRRGRGTLVINTIPWARVFVDGRDTGQNTPVRNLRVSSGSHRIGLRTADGTMHNVNVDVAPGETVRLMRRL